MGAFIVIYGCVYCVIWVCSQNLIDLLRCPTKRHRLPTLWGDLRPTVLRATPYKDSTWASGGLDDGWNPIPNHRKDVWNPIDNEIHYQPQLVDAGFLPSTVDSWTCDFCGFVNNRKASDINFSIGFDEKNRDTPRIRDDFISLEIACCSWTFFFVW